MNWRVLLLALLVTAWGSSRSVSFAQADEKPDCPTPKIAFDPQAGQQNAQDPAQTSPANPQTDDKGTHEKDAVPKRIFFIIPNFMTANDQPENQGPLTPKEKFNIAWHQFFDMSAHFGNLLQAGISQAADGEPHYGQGWGAFGERFAAQEGDQLTGSFLIYGVLPTILHQDPRYFRRGKGSPLSRVGYAASRVVVARTDSGKTTFNASQVFGQLGQAGISLSYYPDEDRNVRGLLVGWAINQIYNVGWNQLKEFTPDLGAYMNRHSKKKKRATDVVDPRSPTAPVPSPPANTSPPNPPH